MPFRDPTPSTRVSLLVRIRSPDDRRAWDEFIGLYAPVIHRVCRRLGVQSADAQDIAQEVLTRVARRIQRFDYDPAIGRFRSWLLRIISNEVHRHTEKARRPGRGVGGEAGGAALEQLSAGLEPVWMEEFQAHVYRTALEGIRGRFDPQVWRAFEMVWVENLRPVEAARRLKRPPEWVYQAKFRVLRRLKEEVQRLAEDAAWLR